MQIELTLSETTVLWILGNGILCLFLIIFHTGGLFSLLPAPGFILVYLLFGGLLSIYVLSGLALLAVYVKTNENDRSPFPV